MSQKLDMTVNRLPAPTWNKLHMNENKLSLALPEKAAEKEIDLSENMLHEVGQDLARDFSQVTTGMGGDVDRLLMDGYYKTDVFRLREGEGTVKMNFTMGGHDVTANFVGIDAKADTKITMIMDFAAGDASFEGAGVVQTKILAGKNALVKLVQIHRAGDEFTLLNDTGAVCEENARVEIIHVILNGKNTLVGAAVALNGKGSSLGTDVAYRVEKDHVLDMNYVANHIGRKTFCDINALGVLRDTASKIFRGTIDFRNGCSGSKGNEKEDVLLMDEGIVNKTIPLILCAEEDVEGNHGATIGEIDEDTMFYLTSRGMTEEAVYALLERGRLVSVINKIPDEETKNVLLAQVGVDVETDAE